MDLRNAPIQQNEEDVQIPPHLLVNLLPANPTQFGQFCVIINHFNNCVQQRKMLVMFKAFEIQPEAEKLLEIHAMLTSHQLAAWIDYLEKSLEVVNENDRQLLTRVLQKLKALKQELPSEELLKTAENEQIIRKIEEEFKQKHGFILVPGQKSPPVLGKMELPQEFDFKTEEEKKMFDIIVAEDVETAGIVQKLTEEGVEEDDERIQNIVTRRYKSKLLNYKYFSIYP